MQGGFADQQIFQTPAKMLEALASQWGPVFIETTI
jgi:hypothetical protein